MKIISVAREKALTLGTKKGGFTTRNESPLFLGGKMEVNYGITVLHGSLFQTSLM
jgi:hypothetical protein